MYRLIYKSIDKYGLKRVGKESLTYYPQKLLEENNYHLKMKIKILPQTNDKIKSSLKNRSYHLQKMKIIFHS